MGRHRQLMTLFDLFHDFQRLVASRTAGTVRASDEARLKFHQLPHMREHGLFASRRLWRKQLERQP
jgi:hypothetical protein